MAAPTITDSVVAVGTGTSVTTGNLTIASGDKLYVGVLLSDGSPGAMTSVTSSGGGGALSSIGDSAAVQLYLRCHVWRSLSPTAGTVTITATPAASTGEIAVIAVAVAGVDAGTPNGTVVFANGNGLADATSASVSSGTDALVLDFIGRFLDGTFSMTAGGGQTILDQANYNNILSAGASTKAGAASVTTTWSRNFMGTVSNYEWVIGALSINGDSGGGGAPSVTDVDTDETITSTQTNVVVTGTDFDTATVEIRQGSTEVAQSIDSQTGTSIQFDVVFDSGATDLKHGAATLAVINGDTLEDTIGITIDAPSGQLYVDIGTPNTTSADRITATADLASGDQLQARGEGGGAAPTGLTLNSDATFYFTSGNTPTNFDVRAWSVADSTWGAWATQTVSSGSGFQAAWARGSNVLLGV